MQGLESFGTGEIATDEQGGSNLSPPTAVVDAGTSLPYYQAFRPNFISAGTSNQIIVSTSNPRTGSQHLRMAYTATSEGGLLRLYVVAQKACNSNAWYTTRVQADYIATFSYWLDAEAVDSGGEQEKRETWFTWYDSSGASLGSATSLVDNEGDSGAYEFYTTSAVAPASAYWVLASIRISGYTTLDLDDLSFTVVP
jgi:hypothetical protein